MTGHYGAYGGESLTEKPRAYDEPADYKSQVFPSLHAFQSSSKSWERDREYKERDRGRYRQYKDSERDRDRGSRHIQRSRERDIDRVRKHRSRSRERFGHKSSDIERNRGRERKHRSRSRERSGCRSWDIQRHIDACKEHQGHIGLCQELIEFYSVTVATNSSMHPYGTIEIYDGARNVIYDRDPDSSSSYKTNSRLERVSTCGRQVDEIPYEFAYEIANLTAPSRALQVHDSFSIDFVLKSEDSPLPNKEMIKGIMDWDPYDEIEYDKVVKGVVKGEYGTASIYYAVFEKAFEAQVEVTLIHGGGGKSVIITAINAFNSCIGHKKILLYSEDKGQGTGPLPLWRPTVVVPFDGTLTIEFDLVMLDEYGRTLAKEPVVFEPKPCGQTKKKIENHCCQIEVNVTWFSY